MSFSLKKKKSKEKRSTKHIEKDRFNQMAYLKRHSEVYHSIKTFRLILQMSYMYYSFHTYTPQRLHGVLSESRDIYHC